jgi:outer membrane protein TolC
VYVLTRCLELADRNYPRIHEARARLKQKQAQANQARTAPFTDFTLAGGLALAPAVSGTALYSLDTDVPIKSDMGLAWQVGIDGVVPLWTFGKITNLWDATDAQVKVGEGEIRKERNEVRLGVRRAFYGVLLARDALSLVREALRRIDQYAGTLEQRLASGDGDEIDLLKLKMHREELIARESEAAKQEAVALSGLRFYTGVEGGMDVPDEPLHRLRHHLGPLAHYLAAARLYRPEVNMARAGVLAREAQMRIERAKLFPDLGLGLSVRYIDATEIADQKNPFVKDIGHAQSYGAALVFRYRLDFLPQMQRLDQAKAQLEEQRATERYALGGVGVEVEQAFRDAEDAGRRLDAYTRAVGYVKKWLVQVQQGIEVGTSEEADVVDPAKEYALKRFSQMSATFDYNIALARLAQATGWEAIVAER